MTLGVSLPITYLAGAPDEHWPAALGAAPAGLDALRQAGVSSIELRSVNAGTDPAAVLAAAHRVWDAGMTLTVHGALPSEPAAAAELDPALLALGPELRRRGQSAMVTVHSYQSVDVAVETLAGQTAEAARTWLAGAARAALPLRLALELNRAQARNDPGTDYESMLAMHARIAHPHAGFCWDFGHAFHNVRQGRLPEDPPPAFVGRVIHTHIHDLGPGDKTHWPLTAGTVPLAHWLGLLRAVGYGGVLNLELDPKRTAGIMDLRTAVFASLALLAELSRAHLSRPAPGV